MKHLFTLLILLGASALFAQVDSTGEEEAEVDSLPPLYPREHRFFLNASAAYAQSYHSISSGEFPELVNCRDDHEQNSYVPDFKLTAGYHFKSWLSVSAGVQYFETGFRFKEQKHLSDTLPDEFAIGCDVYHAVDPAMGFLWYAFYDPRFFSVIHGLHPAEATQKVNVRYYYIGLPVKCELTVHINTTLGPNGFHVFINGGFAPNYMVKQRYDVSFQQGAWNYVYQDSVRAPAPYIRRWNIGASFGGGITYLIQENFEARVEVTEQFQLLNLFNWQLYGTFDYEEKHSTHSLGVSLTYFFP